MTAIVHVCRSCEGRDAVRRQGGMAAGAALRQALLAMVRMLPDPTAVEVVGQDCLGPCGPGVRVALTGLARWGWLFQDLRPGADIAALAAFLQAWQTAPDGVPAKADRPTRLMRKAIGRLPPSGAMADAMTGDRGGPDDDTDG